MGKTIEPAGNRILVKVKELEEKTSGGIVIPEMARKREERIQDVGVIVAVGSCCFDDWGGPEAWEGKKGRVEVGQEVVFARQGGRGVVYPGIPEQLRLLHDTDIQGFIVEDDDG